MITANAGSTDLEVIRSVIDWAKAFGCNQCVIDCLESIEEKIEDYDADVRAAFRRGVNAARNEIATYVNDKVADPEFPEDTEE